MVCHSYVKPDPLCSLSVTVAIQSYTASPPSVYVEFLTGLVILTIGGVLFTDMITLSTSVAPPLSVTVNLTTNFLGTPPALVKTTPVGLAVVLVAGVPPSKFHEQEAML